MMMMMMTCMYWYSTRLAPIAIAGVRGRYGRYSMICLTAVHSGILAGAVHCDYGTVLPSLGVQVERPVGVP